MIESYRIHSVRRRKIRKLYIFSNQTIYQGMIILAGMQLSDALTLMPTLHSRCALFNNDDPATNHIGKITVAYKQWKIRNYNFNVSPSNGGISTACGVEETPLSNSGYVAFTYL
jgi:hypothetical protein